MRERKTSAFARFAPLMVLAASIACAIGAVILQADAGGNVAETVILYLSFLSFGVIGTIVLAKGGSRVMGWIFMAIAFLWTSGDLALELGKQLYAQADPGPLAPLAAWYVEWYWIPLIFSSLVITPIVAPNGQPMNERWGRILRWLLIGLAVVTAAAALDPKLDIDGRVVGDNAIGISPFGDLEEGILAAFFFPFLFASAISGAIALVLRFRRSRGEERQQMKWVAFAGVAFVGMFFILVVFDAAGVERPPLADAVLTSLLPIGLGIAILRYRLYDIDVIINRTIVYGALTALLVGSYLGLVVALQFALDPITKDSDLAVAGSTLAVAALFRPLRARVQAFIDRRFYRRKYDAARTLTAFGKRLRDEVELDVVASQVIGVVNNTVQPAHVSLWVRTEAPS